MITKVTAIFYDGVSSVPQQISLFFDKNRSVFVFETKNKEQKNWKLEAVTFDKRGEILSLAYSSDSIEIINIQDPDFIKSIMAFRKQHGQIGWYQRMIDWGIQSHILLALFIIGIIALSYVYAIPWAAEKSVVLIPEEYDTQLGNTFFEQSILFDSIDQPKTKALHLFAKELKLNNAKQLRFRVVHSNTVNAFALPDGTIVVYSGILKEMKNYDELAGLLGHEASHINNRHTMKMLCRNLSGYLFVSTILGDANGIMAVIGENVNSLQSLSFSREFEREADLEGFKILIANKINPQGMANLFKRLQAQEKLEIPAFLSSHPLTEERIEDINKMIKTNTFPYNDHPKLKNLFETLHK
jgi:beta-barrel assembly-enhancing protease